MRMNRVFNGCLLTAAVLFVGMAAAPVLKAAEIFTISSAAKAAPASETIWGCAPGRARHTTTLSF